MRESLNEWVIDKVSYIEASFLINGSEDSTIELMDNKPKTESIILDKTLDH